MPRTKNPDSKIHLTATISPKYVTAMSKYAKAHNVEKIKRSRTGATLSKDMIPMPVSQIIDAGLALLLKDYVDPEPESTPINTQTANNDIVA